MFKRLAMVQGPIPITYYWARPLRQWLRDYLEILVARTH